MHASASDVQCIAKYLPAVSILHYTLTDKTSALADEQPDVSNIFLFKKHNYDGNVASEQQS